MRMFATARIRGVDISPILSRHPHGMVGVCCALKKGENRMLALNLQAEPYWLDLPRGVRVQIEPVTTRRDGGGPGNSVAPALCDEG